SIHHQFTGTRCRRSDDSTRAHAKRKHSLPIYLLHETVRRRWKVRWSQVSLRYIRRRIEMVLHAVDQRLRMLHTNAQCEWLRFDLHSILMKHQEDVTSRMSRSQYE